jgi:DNA-binding NarL/FixJ family response regulator
MGMPKDSIHRFLLVEDQQLLRELLRTHLRAEFPNCEVVEMESLAQLAQLDKKAGFDLAIVDLQLPDGNAMDWVLQWVGRNDDQRVLVLTASDEDYILYRALNSKVQGFVHKNDDTATLLMGIKAVLKDGLFFSESMKKMRARMGSDPNFFSKVLSEREQEVLAHFGKGLRNAEVGQLMSPPLSPTTIQDYRRRIMAKLGLHREADLIRYANSKGFSRINKP